MYERFLVSSFLECLMLHHALHAGPNLTHVLYFQLFSNANSNSNHNISTLQTDVRANRDKTTIRGNTGYLRSMADGAVKIDVMRSAFQDGF